MSHHRPGQRPNQGWRDGWTVAGVQTALLLILGVGWLTTVAAVALNNRGHVPAELWTVLPFGITSVLVAFRAGNAGNGGKQ